MAIPKQLLESKVCNKENCKYVDIINRLDKYLHKMENVSYGEYNKAIQDTIYFLNALKEMKGE